MIIVDKKKAAALIREHAPKIAKANGISVAEATRQMHKFVEALELLDDDDAKTMIDGIAEISDTAKGLGMSFEELSVLLHQRRFGNA